MPLLQPVSLEAGMISPVFVSVSSSTGSTITKSSRGSSVTDTGCGPSSTLRGYCGSMASPFVELEIGGQTGQGTKPGKNYFPTPGLPKPHHLQEYVPVDEGVVPAPHQR